MSKIQKTVEEIVDETIEYIENHGRALGTYENPFGNGKKENACVYRTENSEGKTIGCAVGRVMRDSAYGEEVIEGNTVPDFRRDGTIDHVLQEEYHGHPANFWSDLQSLHDSESNWNSDGTISEKGKKFAKGIKETYS